MHFTTTDLRAYLDSALPETSQAGVAAHLADCGQCRADLQALAARAERVRGRLAAVAPAPAEAARSAAAALTTLQQRKRKDRIPMFKSLAQRRSVWVGAAAGLALALSFSFAPVRTFAGQFLGLFRVQQIAVLPIDMARLETLHNDPTLTDQLARMFADSVTVTKEPADVVTAASAAEAGALAGFNVRLLGGQSAAPTFTVQDSVAFEVVVNQPQAQALLDEAGRGDLRLPAALDGATIAVNIPAGVNVAYGCPNLTPETEAEHEFNPMGASGGRMGDPRDCVLLGQIPSPSVETPPDLDMVQLAEIGLQFTGMSPDEARTFSQSVDWTSTLVVPIPMNAALTEQVSVDGVTGTLLYRPSDDGVPQRYMVMWVKDGIVYALSAFGSADEGVALANSIQ